MSWVSSSTTACTTTLDAKAARSRGGRAGGCRIVDALESPKRASRNRCLGGYVVNTKVAAGICVRRDSQQDLIAFGIRDFDRVGRLAAVPPSWTAHQPVTSSVGVVLHSVRLYITADRVLAHRQNRDQIWQLCHETITAWPPCTVHIPRCSPLWVSTKSRRADAQCAVPPQAIAGLFSRHRDAPVLTSNRRRRDPEQPRTKYRRCLPPYSNLV